ncbi:tetratricopeptide repeat protein [Clostridiaceae bacterium M8S5]|nr:tetratricopeptide repeat protein [Clostridiaceae bacterium M8S5]
MAENYYKTCKELDECNELIEKYYLSGQYKKCFDGHLKIAEKGYPLAECQIGYFYYEGLGIEKDIDKSFYWTERAAKHGDRDAQVNLAELFYEKGCVVEKDNEKAKEWYKKAAINGHPEAIKKCSSLGIKVDS